MLKHKLTCGHNISHFIYMFFILSYTTKISYYASNVLKTSEYFLSISTKTWIPFLSWLLVSENHRFRRNFTNVVPNFQGWNRLNEWCKLRHEYLSKEIATCSTLVSAVVLAFITSKLPIYLKKTHVFIKLRWIQEQACD